VISREGFYAIQTVAEYTIVSSFKGVRNTRPLFLFRFGGLGLHLCRLMTELTAISLPHPEIIGIGTDPIQAVADEAPVLMTLYEMGNCRHQHPFYRSRGLDLDRLVAQSTPGLFIIGMRFRERTDRIQSMANGTVRVRPKWVRNQAGFTRAGDGWGFDQSPNPRRIQTHKFPLGGVTAAVRAETTIIDAAGVAHVMTFDAGQIEFITVPGQPIGI
jgi:hypothetical protein